MLGLGINELQNLLHRKADEIQREFVQISEQLEELGKRLLEARGDQLKELKEQQRQLRQTQVRLAEEVNAWRDRARSVMGLGRRDRLVALVDELMAEAEPEFAAGLKRVREMLLRDPQELIREMEAASLERETPAGRLLNRARTSYDMRLSDPAERKRAAVQFANTPGFALDDSLLAEIEAALDDRDPLVRETALFTAIEIYRFRAMRAADLEVAHQAVKKLAAINHEAAIPALIEVLENPRTGFLRSEEGSVESDNNRSRLVALLRLVEWHTPAARQALQMRVHDPDRAIVKAAHKALELFPGPWTGPLKKGKGAAKAAEG